MGIDTSVIPEDVDLYSTDNPYGRDSFTENRVYEILVQDSVESTYMIGEDNKLNGDPDKVAVNKSKQTLNNKDYIYTSKVNDNDNLGGLSVPGEFDNGVTKTIAGHFNNSKDAKKSDLVTVAIDGAGNDANVYLYFSKSGYARGSQLRLVDRSKGERVGITVGSSDDIPSLTNLEGLMHNYVVIDAGDYDGDGVDEVAVYVPKAGEHSIRVYDLQIDNTYSDSKADYFTDLSKWKVAWSYPLGSDINMVSLASGDFNHDGIDDLAVSYGLFISPRQLSSSTIKVFFGNRGERYSLFYSSVNIRDPKDPKNPQGPQNEVVRASVAARDLTEDGFPELIIGGNLKEDIQNYKYGADYFYNDNNGDNSRYFDISNLNSRYLAIFSYTDINNSFDKLTGQNFDLFQRDDNGNWAYPCMARDPIKKVMLHRPAIMST